MVLNTCIFKHLSVKFQCLNNIQQQFSHFRHASNALALLVHRWPGTNLSSRSLKTNNTTTTSQHNSLYICKIIWQTVPTSAHKRTTTLMKYTCLVRCALCCNVRPCVARFPTPYFHNRLVCMFAYFTVNAGV